MRKNLSEFNPCAEDVYVLLDKGRVRSHSVLHGRQVAVNYWMSMKLRELQKFSSPDKKRPLVDADLQFIEVPCKVEDQQMTEWFDKACDPDNQWSCVSCLYLVQPCILYPCYIYTERLQFFPIVNNVSISMSALVTALHPGKK